MEAHEATTTGSLAADKTAVVDTVTDALQDGEVGDGWNTTVTGNVFKARTSVSSTRDVTVCSEGTGHDFGNIVWLLVHDTTGEGDTLLMDFSVSGFPDWLSAFADRARHE